MIWLEMLGVFLVVFLFPIALVLGFIWFIGGFE